MAIQDKATLKKNISRQVISLRNAGSFFMVTSADNTDAPGISVANY